MLIHVSRFKEVHQRVFAQVEEWLTVVKRQLKYRSGADQVMQTLRSIWANDYQTTSEKVRKLELGSGLAITTWAEVEAGLSSAVDKIRAQVVNSEMRDAIDYDGNAGQGLNVIAVGGDKLSRGLTLEGLTVSYFLRASKMYDSLMQMGRWFGYRPGYVDLCRLYLTPELELWFRHVARAAEELRERLDHMAMIGATPESYGLRVQSHDIMLVTAQNKMRHAKEFQVSFEGDGKIQTVFFKEEIPNTRNAQIVAEFLSRINSAPSIKRVDPSDTESNPRIWHKVSGADVAQLLASMTFPEESREVNGGRIADYIRMQLQSDELTEWTVAVLAGAGEVLLVNDWKFRTVKRAVVDNDQRYVVKTILSPPDEALDLSPEQHTRALELTNQKRAQNKKAPSTIPDGPSIRRIRGENPERGLLLLYPLSPENAKLSNISVPVFGIVVSFPDSGSGRSVTYRFNTIEQRLELA
jgi:hypothetical protein